MLRQDGVRQTAGENEYKKDKEETDNSSEKEFGDKEQNIKGNILFSHFQVHNVS